MLNKIINVVFMTLAGTAQGIALEYMLEVNNQKTNKVFRIIYWTILAMIPSVLNVMVDSGNSTILVRNAVHWIMAFIAIFWFYLGPVWRRVIAVVLVYFGMTTADLVLLLVMQVTTIDWNVFWDKGSLVSVIFVGIGMSISIVTIAMIAFVWRKVFYKGEKVKYFGFFMIYLLGYIVSIVMEELQIWNYTLTSASLWPILTSIICEIALLAIIFSQSEKDAIEKKLYEEKHLEQLESIHYDEIVRRRNEMISVSANNRTQIEKVKKLFRQGMKQEVEEELKQFQNQIEMTKDNIYCEIPVINALLTEKKRQCDKCGVALRIDVQLMDKIAIQQMDLCSVFANMLDNAIRACEQVIESEIVLTAVIKNGYLIIKCENTSMKVPGLKPEGTGYGLKILKGIAERYSGDFQTKYENHKFTSQIILKL